MKKNTVIFIGTAGVVTAGLLLLTWRARSAAVAAKFIGIGEVGNNQGFSNKVFQEMMNTVGWKSGESWCCYFAKAVYLQAFPKKAAILKTIITPSTQQTWKNIKARPDIFKVLDQPSDRPRKGDLVFWQSTKNSGLGHVGIADEKYEGSTWYNVEGNTSLAGVREGQGVERLKRNMVPGTVQGTLKLLGFARLKTNLFS